MTEQSSKTKQQLYDELWMTTAEAAAKMSHCKRRQVGCVIIKGGRPISSGWNGTPTGFDNCCEDQSNTTLPYTIHAEANALDKISRDGGLGAEGSDMYITTAPCLACAIRIANNGVRNVYYRDSYRDRSGIDFLTTANISTHQI